MLIDTPKETNSINTRTQFAFEPVPCKYKLVPECKGFTYRIRGHSRHPEGVCSACGAHLMHEKRAQRKAADST